MQERIAGRFAHAEHGPDTGVRMRPSGGLKRKNGWTLAERAKDYRP